jgi:hypothetical protein
MHIVWLIAWIGVGERLRFGHRIVSIEWVPDLKEWMSPVYYETYVVVKIRSDEIINDE